MWYIDVLNYISTSNPIILLWKIICSTLNCSFKYKTICLCLKIIAIFILRSSRKSHENIQIIDWYRQLTFSFLFVLFSPKYLFISIWIINSIIMINYTYHLNTGLWNIYRNLTFYERLIENRNYLLNISLIIRKIYSIP